MSIGPLNEKIKERKLIPLHESRYYLIEVPFDMAPDGIRRRLMEFPAMGKIPVLATSGAVFLRAGFAGASV